MHSRIGTPIRQHMSAGSCGAGPQALRFSAFGRSGKAWILFLLAFLATQPLAGQEDPVAARLLTPTVELLWPEGSPTPTQWRISAPSSENGSWRSMIDMRADGPAFSRHLEIIVPGFDFVDWRAEPGHDGAVIVHGTTADRSIKLRKIFAPTKGDYRFSLVVEIAGLVNSNQTKELPKEIKLAIGPGIGEVPVDGLGIATGLYSFVDLIGSASGQIHRGIPDLDSRSQLIEPLTYPEWAGLYSRHFALLVMPVEHGQVAAVSVEYPDVLPENSPPKNYLPRMLLTLADAEPSTKRTQHWEFTVFSGPRSREAVRDEASDFSDTLFPGLWQWMRWLCFGLMWLLEAIFKLIPSWGLSIIVLAVLVRLAMYPLARRALAGQQAFAEVQQRIQPEIQSIKQRYSGGEQSERILQLYERHGTSPLAGLKPLLIVLIQIPVFIALFHVLGQAYELRDAPFLWIDTLAEPDQLFTFGVELPFFGAWFNLLPVLLALTTLLTLRLSPAPAADRTAQRRQNLFLGLMTIGFFLIFYSFPSGMVLYWTAANLLHIGQSLAMRRGGINPTSTTTG